MGPTTMKVTPYIRELVAEIELRYEGGEELYMIADDLSLRHDRDLTVEHLQFLIAAVSLAPGKKKRSRRVDT